MNIRQMVHEDLKPCSQVLEKAFGQAPHNETFVPGNAEQYLTKKFSYCGESSYVAESEDGKILGFAIYNVSVWAKGPQAILEEIAVNPEVHHMGIGRALMEFGNKQLNDLGIEAMMLWVRKNPRLIDFYQKQGFQVSDEYVAMFK